MASYLQEEPECASECRELLLDGFRRHGIEAHITHVPPLIPSDFESLNMRCPHGVMWYTEPTGEQREQWAREATP